MPEHVLNFITMPHGHSHSAPKRQISFTSLIIVPLKQHLGCCVVVPLLLKTVGSLGLLGGLFALSEKYHMYIAFALAPLVVYLCLKFEDKFHNWQHRRGHFADHCHKYVHHDDCTTCEPCPVDHSHHAFQRRFVLNLAIAMVLIAIAEQFHHHA